MTQYNHIPNMKLKYERNLKKPFSNIILYEIKPRKFKISNISKPWISVCIIIAKFIARQNTCITSACSQEAPAVVKW